MSTLIPNATEATYVSQAADVSEQLSVVVTATNTTGTTTATSAATAPTLAAYFSDSFSSGDLTAYTLSTQEGLAGTPEADVTLPPPTVIADPTTSVSRNVCQFDVLSGQERIELDDGNPILRFYAGNDLYFWDAYYLRSGFPVLPASDSFQVLQQLKTDTPTSATGPAVGFVAGAFNTPTWTVEAVGWPGAGSTEAHTLGPMTTGVWTQFIKHVTFSTDATQSVVQVWMSVNGAAFTKVFDSSSKTAETLNGIAVETRAGWWPSFVNETAGSQGGTFRMGCTGGYHKHGIYRDPGYTTDAHLYFAGSRWGASYAAVAGTFATS
jgi:hypothetical protein